MKKETIKLTESRLRKLVEACVKEALEDAMEADETFSILMGDKVEPRREFIEQNAKYVKNLDI
mgnify:CR=1 FL=1